MSRGGAEREKETQNPKQAPGSDLSAQSPTQGSNSLTTRSRPEPNPGTLYLFLHAILNPYVLNMWHTFILTVLIIFPLKLSSVPFLDLFMVVDIIFIMFHIFCFFACLVVFNWMPDIANLIF